MKVQLSLYAKNLPNVAGMFKGTSDPYAVVQRLSEGQTPVKVGTTEVVKNSLEPRWTKRFIINHDLGQPTHLSIAVYDKIPNGKDKPMGSAMFNVGNILGAKGNTKAKRMKGGGVMYAKVQKYEEGGTLRLQLKAVKLKSTEGMGLGLVTKPDPFFELHRQTIDKKGWDVVYRSKPVKNNLSPIWPEANIDIATLCRNKLATPIKVKVLDWESSGNHVDMGEFETSVSGIVAAKNFSSTMDINKADLASAFTLTKGSSKREMGQIVVLRADLINVEGAKPELKRPDKPREAPVPVAVEVTPSEPAQDPPLAPVPDPPQAQAPAPPAYAPPAPAPAAYAPPHNPPPRTHTPPPPATYAPSYAPAPTTYSPPPPAGPPQSFPPPYGNQPLPYAPATHSAPPPGGPPPFVPPPQPAYAPPNSGAPPPYSHPVGQPFVPPGAPAPPAYQTYVPPPPPVTFDAFVRGGCTIHLAVAVDFSSSNGDPRRMGNLHYMSSWEDDKNDYEQALISVGEILAEHDTVNRFPMWGFGGKYGGQIRHCFQCGSQPEVHGIDGLRSAYKESFKSGLAMSEPTVISDVIKTAAYYAKNKMREAQSAGGQAYTILMILTDGQIEDFNATARTIYEVTDTPMSIVGVGVGRGDFTGMHYLDSLKRDGRNIFKFIPFDALKRNREVMKKATMERIPDQLVEYFTNHGIKPNPPGSYHGARDIVL